MTKYTEILVRFKESKLTKKEFGRREGMSASMVGYYLRRAKETTVLTESENAGFTAMEVSPHGHSKTLRIKTPSGIQIDIPI